jgi:hypothetical protein
LPKEWQEVPARDQHGELHIADFRTPHGLVVAFQHSKIGLAEARKRTVFHAPMIPVVDGLRRKTDKTQFDKPSAFTASGLRDPHQSTLGS